MTKRQPFLGWPGWPVLCEEVILGLLQTAWWVFVYHGCDWITGLRSHRVRVHTDAELGILFVPAALLVYRSIDIMFLFAAFVLRTRAEVRSVVLSLFAITSVPAELAYPPRERGAWSAFFEYNERVVLRYNLAPSLHISFSVVMATAFVRRRGPLGTTLLALWAALIAVSTLLTHMHHVIDVVTGALLGWAAYRLVYLPLAWRAEGPRAAPASPSPGPAPPA